MSDVAKDTISPVMEAAVKDITTSDSATSDSATSDIVEDQLRRSLQRFQRAMEAVNDAVWDWDFVQDTLTWSPGVSSLFGYSLEEIPCRIEWWHDHIHADDRERVLNGIQSAIDSGEPAWRDEYLFERADGRYACVLDRGYLIYDHAGKAVQMLGAMLDISSMREREVALEQARQKAEEANDAKDRFLATLSHELRTPLTSMMGWVHLLCTRELDKEAQSMALSSIDRNCHAQLKLIEELLDVSRIVSGKFTLEMSRVNMKELVEQAVEAVCPTAQEKNIDLNCQLDSSTESVPGDAQRLNQVVLNLLSNSIKFTPEGGQVSVVLQNSPTKVQLEVTDNGKGISPEFLPQVFERFRQADLSETRKQGGLGLGLAIVKHIVELHGGQVSAESDGPGKGATFRVCLPKYQEESTRV
ncbi:MAG TPA: PAS domain-containing sensor histidine kinase [Abditibacteriaceae bacterium]|jgi:PAS domain S-box-containing protein